MGIKNIRKATYVSDTGKEFELTEMASSHILNVICHHQKQIDAIIAIPQWREAPNILKRLDGLHETVNVLIAELSNRDPDKDDDIQQRKGFRNDY